MSFFKYLFKAAPAIITGIGLLVNRNKDKNENGNNRNYEIERNLQYQLETLQKERREMERINRDNLERLRE